MPRCGSRTCRCIHIDDCRWRSDVRHSWVPHGSAAHLACIGARRDARRHQRGSRYHRDTSRPSVEPRLRQSCSGCRERGLRSCSIAATSPRFASTAIEGPASATSLRIFDPTKFMWACRRTDGRSARQHPHRAHQSRSQPCPGRGSNPHDLTVRGSKRPPKLHRVPGNPNMSSSEAMLGPFGTGKSAEIRADSRVPCSFCAHQIHESGAARSANQFRTENQIQRPRAARRHARRRGTAAELCSDTNHWVGDMDQSISTVRHLMFSASRISGRTPRAASIDSSIVAASTSPVAAVETRMALGQLGHHWNRQPRVGEPDGLR